MGRNYPIIPIAVVSLFFMWRSVFSPLLRHFSIQPSRLEQFEYFPYNLEVNQECRGRGRCDRQGCGIMQAALSAVFMMETM